MTEYCHRCKAELPPYGHDAICEKCDLILESQEKDAEIERLTKENAELFAKLVPLVIHPSCMVSVNDVNEARELVRRLTEKDGVDGQWEEGREV